MYIYIYIYISVYVYFGIYVHVYTYVHRDMSVYICVYQVESGRVKRVDRVP